MIHSDLLAYLDSELDFTKRKNWLSAYTNFDFSKYRKALYTVSEEEWMQAGKARALKLFHATAKRVPAYKHFLKKNKVNPEKIKTFNDFEAIPITDKHNYISQYSLKERSWDGEVSSNSMVAMSSGTSGDPKMWPRSGYQEFEAAITHELIYRELFEVSKYKTLVIVGFPMGVYVSGIATLLPSWLVSQKYGDLTVVSAGNNKNEVIRMVRHLHGDYEQILLVGHPFFIKDVIGTGKDEGLQWGKIRLRMMFCSEGFNEVWRNFLISETGQKNNPDVALNTYGSSELLLMGYETPFTILSRGLLEKHKVLQKELLGSVGVPNILQFNPMLRYIESVNNELVFSAPSGVPLVRFNIKDSGKVLSTKQLGSIFRTSNTDLEKVLPKRQGIKIFWQLPVVTLDGRSDYAVVMYAANIYPEHIHAGLNERLFLKRLTGKFALRKVFKKNMDETLEVNVELRPREKVSKSFAKQIQSHIISTLKKLNMEYLDASKVFPEKLIPKVILCPYQDDKYFKQGLKPRYIIKD